MQIMDRYPTRLDWAKLAERLAYFSVICVAALLTTSVWGQSSQPISTDGSDPAKWDRNMDGPKAASGNHKIIFENDDIRVQSVTVPPGTEEPYHLHPYYSILVLDGGAKRIVDRDSKGNVIKDPISMAVTKTFPLVMLQPPQALHSIKNNDTQAVHLIRIESKKGVPQFLSFPPGRKEPIAKQGPLPISTDGTDPATWDPRKASAIAAAGNHKVVFENENLRVISVTIPPGTTEPYHDHPYYSLLFIDANVKTVDHDPTGKPTTLPGAGPKAPFVFLQPPQGLHAVQDLDTQKPDHLIRIEFKKEFKQL